MLLECVEAALHRLEHRFGDVRSGSGLSQLFDDFFLVVQPAPLRCPRILATAPVNVTHPNLIRRLAWALPTKTSSVADSP